MTAEDQNSTMAQPAKFTFDTVFERQPDGKIVAPQSFRKADLETARTEGHAEGYAMGRDDALVKAEQNTGNMLNAIATKVTTLVKGLETERAKLSEEACVLARIIAGKLVPTLLADRPTAEIEALLSEALAQMPSAPHVVVRVNDAWLEQIKLRIDEIARARGFAGKLVILGEPDISECDCRLEWADGGVCRDTNALAVEVDRMIERHLGKPLPLFGDDLFEAKSVERQGDR